MSDTAQEGSRLDVEVAEADQGVVLALAGELDVATVVHAEEALAGIAPEHRLVVDLRGLRFMDSTGVRLLMTLDLRARREGWTLVVVRGSGVVAELARLTRLEDRVHVVEDPGDLR